MAREKDERTFIMMRDYMKLREQGFTPGQIAEIYGLSVSAVYSNLQAIADKAGVSRESLLKQPNAEHAPFIRQFAPVKPIDTEGFREKSQSGLEAMTSMKSMIEESLRDAEQYQQTVERREKEWSYEG